jgi:hypothetical protein
VGGPPVLERPHDADPVIGGQIAKDEGRISPLSSSRLMQTPSTASSNGTAPTKLGPIAVQDALHRLQLDAS